jgi:hypothetical protein
MNQSTFYLFIRLLAQLLKLPWPVSPREIVLKREWEYVYPYNPTSSSSSISSCNSNSSSTGDAGSCDSHSAEDVSTSTSTAATSDIPRGGSVTCRYHSVEDPRIPHKQGKY